MAFLELRRVSKSFVSRGTRRAVLRDVNLRVEKGEFVTIVGCSGAGKTTLVSIVAGLVTPDEGEIRLDDRAISGPGPDRGVVFQSYSLLPWMTVFENVHLAVAAVGPGLTRAESRERTEHFLRLVRLENAMWKRPSELSGGMRQRVAVARGLATEPKVLLLDEPFCALDALTRAHLQNEMARIWAESHATIIMITNDIDEAILLGDRICPLTAPPGATLGASIPVAVARPRVSRQLSLDPGYQQARKALVDFLSERRPAPRSGNVVALVPHFRDEPTAEPVASRRAHGR